MAWFVFVAAALLEVSGDAVIRCGLRGKRFGLMLAGSITLASYGFLVNSLKWDFSKMLGVYVGFFALVSVLFGRIVLYENVPMSTWLGLALIIVGCLIVQFGHR